MGPALIVQAVGLFALTNIDDDLDLNWGTPADQERRDELLLAFCAALAVLDTERLGPRQHHRVRRRDLEGGQYGGGPRLRRPKSIPKGAWWVLGHSLGGLPDAAGRCIRDKAQLAQCALRGVTVVDEDANSHVDG